MNYEEVTLEKLFLELTGETNITAGTNNSAEKKSLEEEFAEKAVEDMKNSAEESTEKSAETETAEPEEAPAPAKEEKKSKKRDDDYKPLFGGN